MKKTVFISVTTIIVLITPLLLLSIRLGSFPPTLFNWENYTVWHLFGDSVPDQISLFTQSRGQTLDGLMTESGQTLPLSVPIRAVAHWFGLSLGSVRVWPMLLTFSGLVLYYYWTRRNFGYPIALLSTVFFGTSQALLVYGRTATIVGPTLLAEMFTLVITWKGITQKTSIWVTLTALAAIYANYYFYGPIRLATPLLLLVIVRWLYSTISKLSKRFVKQKPKQRFIQANLLIGIICCCTILVILNVKPIMTYYKSRGEQVLSVIRSPAYEQNPKEVLLPYLQRSLKQYAGLITSYDSKPTLESVNDHFGQIINPVLVPFFFLGLLGSSISVIRNRSRKHAALILWYSIYSLPILFTTNVHVGRLFLSLAPLYIFVAIGISKSSAYLLTTLAHAFTPKLYWQLAVTSMLLLLGASVTTSEIKHYFFANVALDHNVKLLIKHKPAYEHTQLYVVNFEPTALHYWEMVFYLQQFVRFEDYPSKKPIELFRYSDQSGQGYLVQDHTVLTPGQCEIGQQDYAIFVGFYQKADYLATTNLKQTDNRCVFPDLQLFN